MAQTWTMTAIQKIGSRKNPKPAVPVAINNASATAIGGAEKDEKKTDQPIALVDVPEPGNDAEHDRDHVAGLTLGSFEKSGRRCRRGERLFGRFGCRCVCVFQNNSSAGYRQQRARLRQARAHSRLAAASLLRNHRAMRRGCAIMSVLLFWSCAFQALGGGLDRYRALVVADPAASAASLGKIRVTYLGTNGYRFETGKHALLVDPYFSRVGLGAYVFHPPIESNMAAIENAADFFANTEVILATHGHVDHLLDVPPIMQMTGARLLASRTAVDLATAAGAAPARCAVVRPGDVRQSRSLENSRSTGDARSGFSDRDSISRSAERDRSSTPGE